MKCKLNPSGTHHAFNGSTVTYGDVVTLDICEEYEIQRHPEREYFPDTGYQEIGHHWTGWIDSQRYGPCQSGRLDTREDAVRWVCNNAGYRGIGQ